MKKSLGLIAWRLYLTIVITLFAVAQANAQYWEMWDDDFKDIEIEKVIDNGPQENLLNIAVCAEGYTQEQLNVFKDDAIQLINELLDEQPYRNYRNFINVYLVYTPSYTSGIGSQQNTFFGATIEGERIVRLANNFYFTLKGIRFPWCQKGIILMNTSINGGSAWAGELMAFSKSQLRTVTLRHEMGHVMGHCADEYSGYDGANYERHNLTRESDPEKVPWKNWIGEKVTHVNGWDFGYKVDVVPVYFYGTNAPSGWYQPYKYCIMGSIDGAYNPYCPACREGIIVKMHEWTNSILKQSPEKETTVSEAGSITFTVDAIKPMNDWKTCSNAVKWFLDGKQLHANGYELTLPKAELAPGMNKIEVLINDTTWMVRRDNKDELLTDTATWNVNATNATPLTAITIGKSGYTTFYTTIAYVMPAGLKGFIVTEEENQLKLVAAYPEGSIVPARTPLLIEGTSGSYNVQRSETINPDISDNLLIGTAAETQVTAAEQQMVYRLMLNTEETHIGFYLEDPTGQTATNLAGEAYLLLPSNILSYEGYTLSKVSTSIQNILENTDNTPKTRYSIDGKQLPKHTTSPAVIIMNGQKKVTR